MGRATHLAMRACMLAAAAAMLPGCDDATGPATALSVNRRMWEQRGPEDYDFEFHRFCFCLDTAIFPVRITVQQGAVTGVVRIPGGEPLDAGAVSRYFNVTLDSLFGVVEYAIAIGADRLSVAYHPFFGYPTDVTIDYDTQTADEEMAFDALLTPGTHSASRQRDVSLGR